MNDFYLQPVNFNDLKEILLWRNDESIRKNMFNQHIISWQEHVTWFNNLQKDKNKKHFIVYLGNNKIGVVYFNLDKKNKNCFWGLYAKPKSPVNSGLIMGYLGLRYVFNELAFHKLNCETISHNLRAISFFKKCGFSIEGTFRDFHYDGQSYFDVVRMGMLKDEWYENSIRIKKQLNI